MLNANYIFEKSIWISVKFAYYVVTSALKHLFPVLIERFLRINFCVGRNYVMTSLIAFIFHEVFIVR